MNESRVAKVRALTAFIAISAGLVSFTSLEFMLEAIQSDFSMSSDATMFVSTVASGACLIVVFLVGVVADRFGDRRVLVVAGSVFCTGAVIVASSPNPAVLLVGLAVGGVGSISMAIVGLSVLNSTFPGRRERAKAFGLFALAAPVVAIIAPMVSSAIVPTAGWRYVTAVWFLIGLVTVVLSRRVLSAPAEGGVRAEFVSPTLAGLTLSAIALGFSFANINSQTHLHRERVVISAGVAVAALIALVIAMRLLRRPTLDLRSLRARGSVPVFAAVFIVNGVNLFFFTYLLLQFRYHLTSFDTALLLILPQATAACGALLGGRFSARWGTARVATVALVAAAVASLGAFFVSADSRVIVPILVLAVAGVPIAAAVGPITHSFMDLSPEDGTAATSSVRNSGANLGVAIAGLISGSIIFDRLDASSARTAEVYGQQAAAFHLAGVMCAVAYGTAAGLMVVHARRRRVTLS